MAEILTKGTLFPEALVPELVNLVQGHSSLAKMTGASPVAFTGNKEFTFTMDKEIDIVAENGAKTKGGATVTPVTIVPIKVEYGCRVSDEFKYASEEVQLDYLRTFAEGFAKKLAKGIDIMAMHGVNPRTGSASAVIGNNCFDKAVTNVASGDLNSALVETAVELITATDNVVDGIIMSTNLRSGLAQEVDANGNRLFPELMWGGNPEMLNGLKSDVNTTVTFGSSTDKAIVGDFADAFRWGYAKEIPLEVIEYGNPDNDTDLGDLKGHNQVYLRGEAYVGWGILDKNAFAICKEA